MKFSFQFRIAVITSIMVFLIIMIGFLAYFTAQSLRKVSQTILKENVASLKAAEELQLALLNQKGYILSYFLDGDERWLHVLDEKKTEFDEWFQAAQQVALTEEERPILDDILKFYGVYDAQRNKAIRLFQAGQIKESYEILLNDMKESIDDLYQRCDDLILVNEAMMVQSEQSSQRDVSWMTLITWTMIFITLLLGVIMGFTVSRRVNQQLIRHAQLSSLGQVAANIAHEIRNPITSIKMRLYTLQKEMKDNSGGTDDLNVIREDIDNMEKTVRNFLDFSRPPEPRFEEAEIKEVLDATGMLLLPKAQAGNIHIKKDYAGINGQRLRIDREQMRRAFLNIMLNAIEAMPQGGVLRVAASREKDNAVKIIFEDTGQGISPADKNRILEPFFTTKKEGTGLGLFITQRIIRAHKGKISIGSHSGQGTSVVISLPAVNS